ncbi:hypothetical protein CQW23_02535 [Capsicum baccatum]|uniref:Uncharacterized protein n=1 Tax=Capsicum baccatum TaxID=33114 RepID=A0A2G2XRR7_CAPBA|nr:hypothetical protein CQW23_02535 [Capsicum baccatum]
MEPGSLVHGRRAGDTRIERSLGHEGRMEKRVSSSGGAWDTGERRGGSRARVEPRTPRTQWYGIGGPGLGRILGHGWKGREVPHEPGIWWKGRSCQSSGHGDEWGGPVRARDAGRRGAAVHVIAAAGFVAGLVISLSLWFVVTAYQASIDQILNAGGNANWVSGPNYDERRDKILAVTTIQRASSKAEVVVLDELISFGTYDILVAEKLLALFNSMKFTCLSEGKGYHFPPCHIVNRCGFRVLIDCRLDLSALAVFSPLSTVISSLFDERTSNDRGQSLSSSGSAREEVAVF